MIFGKEKLIVLKDEAKLWLSNKGDSLADVNVKLSGKFSMKTMWLRWKGSLLLAAIGLALCYFLYSWLGQHPNSNPCIPVSHQDAGLDDMSYYCNFLEKPVIGKEGEVPLSEYVLEQVQVVIRHGDRSSLHTLPNYIKPRVSCNFQDYPELTSYIPDINKFKETMSNNLRHLVALPEFSGYGLHPAQISCMAGYLTPIGTAQHIKNGAFLREVYSKWNLLELPVKKKHIKLVTTNKRRTFQSGVALMYGLLPKFDLSQIEFHTAVNSGMCMNETDSKFPCHCEAIMNLHDVTSSTFGQTHPNMTDQEGYKGHYIKIAEVLGVQPYQVPRASHVMDVGMVHVCHDLPLPGRSKKCMEENSLKYLVNAINRNGLAHVNSATFLRMARLRMLPLLNHIYQAMMDKISGKSDHKIVLYSGHDSTIDPLLVALNMSTGVWPMYASRVTIELYSTRDSHIPKAYFIRVLYNGIDMTRQVVFCKTVTAAGLCSLDNFKKFLHDDNGLADLKLSDYVSECKKPFVNLFSKR